METDDTDTDQVLTEVQVADVYVRARSGEPFGTKGDISVLINKLCDHIYRKLIDDKWCPCDRHSNTSVKTDSSSQADSGNPNDAEAADDTTTESSLAESYMGRVREKVQDILSPYLASFKTNLLAKCQIDPFNLLSYTDDTAAPPLEENKGGEEFKAEDATSCQSEVESDNSPRNVESLISRKSRSSELSDWRVVSRCVSRDESIVLDQPPALKAKSSSTSMWSSDPDTDDGSKRIREYFPSKSVHRVGSDDDSYKDDFVFVNLPLSQSEHGVKFIGPKMFKKTNNPNLIKRSWGKVTSPEANPSQVLMTETADYREQHFRASVEALLACNTDTVRAVFDCASATECRAPVTGRGHLQETHIVRSKKGGQGHRDSTARSHHGNQTHIGGVPIHLFLENKQENATLNKRKSSRVKSPSSKSYTATKKHGNKLKKLFSKLRRLAL